MQSCTYRGCDDPATATVLVGATRLPVCFTHEREYADRYGPADILPLAQPVRPRWIGRAAADLTGRHRAKRRLSPDVRRALSGIQSPLGYSRS